MTKKALSGVRVHFLTVLLFAVSTNAEAAINVGLTVNPDPMRPGEWVRVKLNVTNDGVSAVDNLVLHTTLPELQSFATYTGFVSDGGRATCPGANICEPGETLDWNVGTLAAGVGRTFSYSARLQDAVVAGTTVTFPTSVLANGILQDSDSVSVPVAAATSLTLEVDENRDPVSIGNALIYTLSYANRATESVTAVSLSFPLPAGTTFESARGGTLSGSDVVWSLGNLAPGEHGQRQVTVQVIPTLAAGTLLSVRSAAISGTLNAQAQSARAMSLARIGNGGLNFATEWGPDPVRPGEWANAQLTVTNRSDVPLSDLRVLARVPTQLQGFFANAGLVSGDATCYFQNYCEPGELMAWNLGTLPPGAGRTFTFDAKVHGTEETGQLITLEALVSSGDGQQIALERTGAIDTDNALSLEVDESHDPVIAGSDINYTLTYANRSSEPVENAILLFPIPQRTAFVSASDGGTQVSGRRVRWALGTLAPGQSGQQHVVISTSPSASDGRFFPVDAAELTGNKSGQTRESARAMAETRVLRSQTLNLGVEWNPDPVRPSEWAHGEVTVTNTGAGPLANVPLLVRIPHEVEPFATNTGRVSGLVTCLSSQCIPGEMANWNLGVLPPGGAVTVSFAVPVLASQTAGQLIRIQALAQAGDQQAVLEQTGAIDTDNRLNLEADESRDPVGASSQLVYTLVYGNRGSQPVTNGELVFPLPGNTSFVNASDNGQLIGSEVRWPLGTLSAGAGGFRKVMVAVPAGAVPGSLLPVDAVRISGSGAGPESARATVVNRVVSSAPLSLRVAIQAPNQPDDTTKARLMVTNTSGTGLSDVTLLSRVPFEVNAFTGSSTTGGGACVSGSCDIGELVTWNLGAMDIGQVVTVTMSPQVGSQIADGRLIHVYAQAREAGGGEAVASDTVIVGPSADADQDGVPDSFELTEGLNPNNPADARLDPDADDLSNAGEYQAGTDLNDPDTDDDDVTDGSDNCPLTANGGQLDVDFDSLGDACDPVDSRTNGPDTLTGTERNETLNGLGGADTMIGRRGDDIYIVQHPGDTVVEVGNAGIDTIRSSVSYTLPLNVEKLFLIGTAAIDGTGNGLNNQITGNDAANKLDGKAGADLMTGHDGNDTYTVDDVGDKVVEVAGDGTDVVLSSRSYTLPPNVENLRLTSSGPANGTGNGLNNFIQAGPGDNVLNGGSGIDTVSYRFGTVTGATAGVTVNLAIRTAQPTRRSGRDALNGFENLTGSEFSDVLTGNSAANVLSGLAGTDTLNGGAGIDTLTGGPAPDKFLFKTALGSSNVDKITDFRHSADDIVLENAVFQAVTSTGTLAAREFRRGTAATRVDHRIIYDDSTGHVYYDPDGTGPAAQVRFARLLNTPELTNLDFEVQ
jgi:uncharacterized repeat protein (TIGR01451 family)